MPDNRMPLLHPVPQYADVNAISQRFGRNADAYAVFGLAGHNGLDFGIPSGCLVISAGMTPGKVVYASPTDRGPLGIWCKVVHTPRPGIASMAYTLVYAHLSNLTVCLLYTSPSPRDRQKSRMPSSA